MLMQIRSLKGTEATQPATGRADAPHPHVSLDLDGGIERACEALMELTGNLEAANPNNSLSSVSFPAT